MEASVVRGTCQSIMHCITQRSKLCFTLGSDGCREKNGSPIGFPAGGKTGGNDERRNATDFCDVVEERRPLLEGGPDQGGVGRKAVMGDGSEGERVADDGVGGGGGEGGGPWEVAVEAAVGGEGERRVQLPGANVGLGEGDSRCQECRSDGYVVGGVEEGGTTEQTRGEGDGVPGGKYEFLVVPV